MTALRTVEIDLGGASTKEEVHNRIAQALGFPDYYGRNWDAFELYAPTMARMVPVKKTLGQLLGYERFSK